MNQTVVINVVGLTEKLIGEHTPALKAFRDKSKLATIEPVLPAVTTTVQTTYLTGKQPNEHGIVGNGWYFREESEIHFWKQSDALVQSPRIWDIAKKIDPRFTCANICWWYAMYSKADYTVTPRPMYPADGRKLPDVWTHPGELRDWLQKQLGQFPLFKFWGPMTTIESTRWIADAAILIEQKFHPTLSLVYLPHLDYCMQRRGPESKLNSTDLREVDVECGKLIRHFESRGAKVIVLSEYGIEPVSQPVHLNIKLRESGMITVREEVGRELLDAGASKAFAVADHQVAHIYVNDKSQLSVVKKLVESIDGVERVLDDAKKKEFHLDHPRSGELIAIAKSGCWFTYYYWLDDAKAPDFARTVDIHRKPGYDPAELFLDPSLKFPKLKVAGKLAKRKLGLRALLDVIGLDASMVRGSHGRVETSETPVVMSAFVDRDHLAATDICNLIMAHLLG